VLAIGLQKADEEDKSLDEKDRKFEHRDTEKMRKNDEMELGAISSVPYARIGNVL